MTSPPGTEGAHGRSGWTVWVRPAIKAGVLLAAMLAALWLVYLSPLREDLGQMRAMNERLGRYGLAAPLAYMGLVAGLVAVGCPRLIFCPLGGLAFGFWGGLAYSQLGTLAGSYAMFLFVRWGGRDLILRCWPRAGRLGLFFEQRGLASVVLIRQLPVGGAVLNLILGLTPVRHRHFLAGTLLGNLPEAVPCTLMGSSTVQAAWLHGMGQGVFSVVLLVLVWIGSGIYLHRSRVAVRVREAAEEAMTQ